MSEKLKKSRCVLHAGSKMEMLGCLFGGFSGAKVLSVLVRK